MTKQLEKYIQNQAAEFNRMTPPEDLWDRIEHNMDRKKPRLVKLSLVITVAAMLLIVASTAIIFWEYKRDGEMSVSNINPEMAKQEVQFASLIEIKRKELAQIAQTDPALYREFAAEIQKMDATYQTLKTNLPDSPNPEETVKAMIWNLQIQIRVLNQQLHIIQQINQSKKENRYENQNI